MERRTIILLATVIVVALGATLGFRHVRPAPRSSVVPSAPLGAAVPQARATDPGTVTKEIVAEIPEQEVSPQCRALRTRIRALDVASFTDPRRRVGFESPLVRPKELRKALTAILPAQDPCASEIRTGTPIGSIHGAVMKSCQAEGTLAGADAACFRFLQIYHAMLIDDETRTIPLDTLKDERILMAKLTANFLGRPDSPDPEQVIRIADRLSEVSPGNGFDVFADRMRYEKLLMQADPEKRARMREDLEQKLQKETAESASPTLIEIRALLAQDAGDADQMRELAQELKTDSPEKSEYYLAWAAYLGSRKEEAVERLTKIASTYQAARFALEQLGTGKAETKPFSDIGLGWGFPAARTEN